MDSPTTPTGKKGGFSFGFFKKKASKDGPVDNSELAQKKALVQEGHKSLSKVADMVNNREYQYRFEPGHLDLLHQRWAELLGSAPKGKKLNKGLFSPEEFRDKSRLLLDDTKAAYQGLALPVAATTVAGSPNHRPLGMLNDEPPPPITIQSPSVHRGDSTNTHSTSRVGRSTSLRDDHKRKDKGPDRAATMRENGVPPDVPRYRLQDVNEFGEARHDPKYAQTFPHPADPASRGDRDRDRRKDEDRYRTERRREDRHKDDKYRSSDRDRERDRDNRDKERDRDKYRDRDRDSDRDRHRDRDKEERRRERDKEYRDSRSKDYRDDKYRDDKYGSHDRRKDRERDRYYDDRRRDDRHHDSDRYYDDRYYKDRDKYRDRERDSRDKYRDRDRDRDRERDRERNTADDYYRDRERRERRERDKERERDRDRDRARDSDRERARDERRREDRDRDRYRDRDRDRDYRRDRDREKDREREERRRAREREAGAEAHYGGEPHPEAPAGLVEAGGHYPPVMTAPTVVPYPDTYGEERHSVLHVTNGGPPAGSIHHGIGGGHSNPPSRPRSLNGSVMDSRYPAEMTTTLPQDLQDSLNFGLDSKRTSHQFSEGGGMLRP